MKKELTDVVFVLDRSGSMAELTDDTIGGFNAFIEKQRAEPGDCRLTTVLFHDQYEILHDGIELERVGQLTGRHYFASHERLPGRSAPEKQEGGEGLAGRRNQAQRVISGSALLGSNIEKLPENLW